MMRYAIIDAIFVLFHLGQEVLARQAICLMLRRCRCRYAIALCYALHYRGDVIFSR